MAEKTYKQYLKEEAQKETVVPEIFSLVSDMLFASAQIHIDHFRATSGFKHEALAELYDKLQDWADELCEATAGFSGDVKFSPAKLETKIDDDPIENAIRVIEDLAEKLSKLAEEVANEGLNSILTDQLSQLGGYLYKLRHFEG